MFGGALHSKKGNSQKRRKFAADLLTNMAKASESDSACPKGHSRGVVFSWGFVILWPSDPIVSTRICPNEAMQEGLILRSEQQTPGGSLQGDKRQRTQ